MKVIEKVQTTATKTYVCEVCNKEYGWDFRAKDCEKAHACIHKWEFEIEKYDDEVESLSEKCCLCGKERATIYIHFRDEVWLDIYNLVKDKYPYLLNNKEGL